MTPVDFPSLLKTLVDNGTDGKNFPVYLAIGFLSGALEDDNVQQDLIAYGSEQPFQLARLRALADKLQSVVAKAEHAND